MVLQGLFIIGAITASSSQVLLLASEELGQESSPCPKIKYCSTYFHIEYTLPFVVCVCHFAQHFYNQNIWLILDLQDPQHRVG